MRHRSDGGDADDVALDGGGMPRYIYAMAYSDFSLAQLVRTFKLELKEGKILFPDVAPVQPSTLLRTVLDEQVPLAMDIHTEKARSELIVIPILVELRRRSLGRVGLFSGVEFSVAPEQGLNGICDYLISQAPEQLFIRAPVLAVVEAKNDNIKSGFGQCAAEMLAAQMFNQREDEKSGAVYGAVTTGTAWRFLRLDGSELTIDRPEYHIERVDQILGILMAMVGIHTP